MEHGETRNQRIETETVLTEFYTTPWGRRIVMPGMEISQPVSDRWCEVCNQWVTAKGVMGGLLCPLCHTPWKAEYRE